MREQRKRWASPGITAPDPDLIQRRFTFNSLEIDFLILQVGKRFAGVCHITGKHLNCNNAGEASSERRE